LLIVLSSSEREANTHESGDDADDISQSHVWDESQVIYSHPNWEGNIFSP
jgi:hypothetical protein